MWTMGRSLFVGIAMATSAIACSGGSLNGNATGTGGGGGGGARSTGTAGTGDAGSTGVAGTGGGSGGAGSTGTAGTGDAGSPLMLPDCLADLIGSCAPIGACVNGPTDGGVPSHICFEAGVRVTQTVVPDDRACGFGLQIARVTKPDGSLCYSVESYVDNGMACEGWRYTWKDAAGQAVANAISNPYLSPTLTITCTQGGVSTCDNDFLSGPGNSCCGLASYGVPVCPDGVRISCTTGSCAAGG
jgi:hypothetical protein